MKKAKIAVLVLTLTLFVGIFYSLSAKVFASSNPFAVNYNILYTITKAGTARVSYHINIKNLTQSEYASSYSLTLTNTDITNISVIDNNGASLPFHINKSATSDTVVTTFPQASFGYGSGENWYIQFTTSQVSKIQGKLLNIAIPAFQKKALIQNINTEVVVPNTFGKVNYVSPTNPQIRVGVNNTYISFNNAQSYTKEGILLVMGNNQVFKFKFQYKLANTNPLFKEQYKVVVPADFSTQKVLFSQISPTPQKTYIDSDGNYVLIYILNPKQKAQVKITGQAQVFPTYNALSKPNSIKKELSPAEYKVYTAAQPYWQVANPFIHTLALKITKGDSTNLSKALSIENYVASHLTYNQKAIFDSNRQRLGALKALEDPTNAICQEYVDVFVTLARSVGVPARMIAGYGDPPNINVNPLPPDILHAWVQFYSSQYGWVNADPTWQSTSGNLNFFGNIGSSHFALVRYGISSVNPPLILSFVKEKNPQNNINIQATNTSFNPHINFTVTSPNLNNLVSGFKNYINIVIDNTGNQVLRNGNIKIFDKNKKLISTLSLNNNALFPGTKEDIQIPIISNSMFKSYSKQITISVDLSNYQGNSITKKINTLLSFKPFFVSGIIPWIIVFILFILSIIIVDIIYRVKNTKNKASRKDLNK